MQPPGAAAAATSHSWQASQRAARRAPRRARYGPTCAAAGPIPPTGSYSGAQNTNLTLGSNVMLQGVEGAAPPTVDCGGVGRAMTITSNATLKGGCLLPQQAKAASGAAVNATAAWRWRRSRSPLPAAAWA